MILPVSLNPISRRKDKSVKLSFETREMMPDETMALMAMEGAEMWMSLATSEEELPEAPSDRPEVDSKTPATRMRNVLYILYKKAVDEKTFVGIFDVYYKERMEKLIELLKGKIE